MPATQTALFGTAWATRVMDLTGMTEFRLIVTESVVGFAGATLRAQYSADGGANWFNLESAGTTADVDISISTGLRVSAWAGIEVAAASDVQLRIVGQGGNGSTDPAFRYIALEFR